MTEYAETSSLPEKLNLQNPDDTAIFLAEAIARMEHLNMSPNAISALEEGTVWLSEGIGALYEIAEDSEPYERFVVEETRNKGFFPYHVIHTIGEIGELYAVLIIGSYPEEWEMDRQDLEDGIVLAGVYNKTHDFDDWGP